jgi:hypothetical protein
MGTVNLSRLARNLTKTLQEQENRKNFGPRPPHERFDVLSILPQDGNGLFHGSAGPDDTPLDGQRLTGL